ADDAAGARPVVDHDLLAHALAQLLRQDPAEDVRDAARARGNDDAHRTRRVLLRACGCRQRAAANEECGTWNVEADASQVFKELHADSSSTFPHSTFHVSPSCLLSPAPSSCRRRA